MRYKEIKPPIEFGHFVQCFWFLDRDYSREEDREVLWPDGCYEIIFHFGAAYEIDGQPLDQGFLIGSLTRYHVLNADGPIRLFGIRLKPWGLKCLADVDVKSFRDQFLPLASLFGEEKVRGLAAVLEEKELEEGVAVLREFLLGLLQQESCKEHSFLDFLSEIYDQPVGEELQAIYEKSHYSPRQFERKTVELTGLSPKKLRKAARFNQVRLRIFFNPEIDLHDCMNDYGYYDYAHFSKDFKESIGLTPHEYKNWMLEKLKPGKKQKDVVFLQEE